MGKPLEAVQLATDEELQVTVLPLLGL